MSASMNRPNSHNITELQKLINNKKDFISSLLSSYNIRNDI